MKRDPARKEFTRPMPPGHRPGEKKAVGVDPCAQHGALRRLTGGRGLTMELTRPPNWYALNLLDDELGDVHTRNQEDISGAEIDDFKGKLALDSQRSF